MGEHTRLDVLIEQLERLYAEAQRVKYYLFTHKAPAFSSPSIELMARDGRERMSTASVVFGARTMMDAQLSYRFSHR
jgi:hypothetical protein